MKFGTVAVRSAIASVGAFIVAMPTVCRAIDWTDIPVVQDDACEFRSGLWHSDTAKRFGLRSVEQVHTFGIARAQQRCKNGMVLLISTMTSGDIPTLERTLAVARALCKVSDIQQTQRRAFDQYYITDIRCPISKIGVMSGEQKVVE